MLGFLGSTALVGCALGIPTAQLGDDPFEGGIGGTGIVGLMTGTGSVLVNGLRVEVPGTARVYMAGQVTSDAALVPGVALSIVARTTQDRFEAQHIDVDVPLVGVLVRADGGYAVNGTPLELEGGVRAAPLLGRQAAAHGVWQSDGRLRTSLLRAHNGDAVASGVLALGSDAGWRIGQTPVVPPRGLRLTAGQFVVARGAFADGVLSAQSVQVGRFRRGGGAIRQLSVEGYLEPVATAPGFAVSGLGHSFDQRLMLAPFAAHRAVYFGPYDGRFRARRAVVLPNATGARRTLLRPADGAAFAAGLTGDAARAVGGS
ncbi:MAG: hypothetical protein AAF214_06275 [Pseudomonadota bacterium]